MENRKIRILAIDDNNDNLISLKALILEEFPEAVVSTTQSGRHGLELAAMEDPDVILLDIIMPGMDGFEVCSKLKADQKLRDIPVVFLTAAKGDKVNRIKALESGAEAFLAKPIDEIELTAQIRAMRKIRASNIQKRDEKALLAALIEEKTRELKESNKKTLQLLDAVKREQALIQAIFDSIPGYLYVYDESGKLIRWNKQHESMTGYSAHELSEMTLDKWFDPADMERVKATVRDMFEKGYGEVEAPLKLKDGRRMLVRSSGVPLIWDGHRYFTGIGLDITERKKNERELLYLSNHDHLTGLHNRRFFEEELIRLDTKKNLPLSIIMCDVNGLKLVNDSFGHDVGDLLLKKTANTIKQACRSEDLIARIGGDEFVVILPRTTINETLRIANNIKETAAKEKVANIELSISCGNETKTTDKQSIIEVVANAENHMYRHKLYERSSLRSKTIDLIMNTLFEKSNREAMHSNRVSRISQSIASKMNFNKDAVDQMKIAGLIHDIGKIGVDENILNKPGRLTLDERRDIERHPEIGWKILSSANEFLELAQFVLDHHENWDGSGYPNGLKGKAIPVEARIISIADAYDAMTSERSYKKGMSQADAIKELNRCSGTQFDPEIVAVFVDGVLPDLNNHSQV